MQWKLLESAWDEVHKKFGMQRPFHMAPFMARHQKSSIGSQYSKWAQDDPEAIHFLSKLDCVIQLFCLSGFSCIVPMEIYKDVSSAFPLEKIVPPYALAARTCVAALHEWQVNNEQTENQIEIVLERGDLGQGDFTKLMIVEGMEIPIYKNKNDHAGLEAADVMAWEQSFYLKRELNNEHLPPRPPFSWLLNVPHRHLIVTQEMLLNLCRLKGIDPRTGFRS